MTDTKKKKVTLISSEYGRWEPLSHLKDLIFTEFPVIIPRLPEKVLGEKNQKGSYFLVPVALK